MLFSCAACLSCLANKCSPRRRFNDGPQLSPGPIQNRNTARDALVFPPLRVAGNFARPRVATVFLALAGYSTQRVFMCLKGFETLGGLFIVAHRFLAWLPKIPETHPPARWFTQHLRWFGFSSGPQH